jgi:cyclohexanone monooxygenase
VSQHFDAVVVGAGFAGLYMLHRLREQGLTARVFETGDGVGGTWYWNRYPGARCDIESLEYSYQFSEELQQEWQWTERYSPQAEILKYANHVADRFDLRPDIQLETRVEAARFDDDTGLWNVRTDKEVVTARFFIMATGCLSSTNMPDFDGINDFLGDTYHTGNWPHEGVDFTGKRVGIIGTGSSAIQSIPLIAEQAEHLYVFQRSPNYSVPAWNQPLDARIERQIKADYRGFRAFAKEQPFGAHFRNTGLDADDQTDESLEAEYERRWTHGGLPFMGAYEDLIYSQHANDTAAEFIRNKIRQQVEDPRVAELLCPHSVVGGKRLCVDTDYYQTFNRPNVTLVDVSETPVDKITASGLTVGDQGYELDAIVFATGFDAMTGAILKVDIHGKDGLPLAQKWEAGPRTYLGLMVEGFPNLFTITGPGSPSVLSNMLPSIEQHVEWISECVAYLDEREVTGIEPSREAEDAWVEHVNEVAEESLYPTCNSWYLGANVPGKPRVFMPYLGFPAYKAKCEEVVANDYEGFTLTTEEVA